MSAIGADEMEAAEQPELSILSDKQFADTAQAHLLLGDYFYIWQSYGKVHITYTDGNKTLYDQETMRSMVKFMMIEGAKLTITYNGTLIYSGYTHADTFENMVKYQLADKYNSLAVTAIVAIMISLLIMVAYWYKYERRLI